MVVNRIRRRGALVAASTLAFQVIKWVGVAYLVYLGVHLVFVVEERFDGVKPLHLPRVSLRSASPAEPIMQPKGPIGPEFDLDGRDPKTTPKRRTRNLPTLVLGFELLVARLKRCAAIDWLGLCANPSAELRTARPPRKVGVGLGRVNRFGDTVDQHLFMEHRGGAHPQAVCTIEGAVDGHGF